MKFYYLLFLLLFVSPLWAQQQVITGKVSDEKGAPIPMVNVSIKGTSVGVTSNVDGTYSLVVPADTENPALLFSFVGFADKEENVDGRTTVNVILSEDVSRLDEVVVVGYSTQKKSSLTGAMAAISDKKLLTVTSPRVENMLNGKAPGVFVIAGSGQPGNDAKIVIRGKTTVNGSTDPLWVIDGVIVGSGSGDLNPSDIESMTILKDAASTAIYGSQGSNGVVVITTKKGKSGKATVNASVKLGATRLAKGNLEVMNSAELYEYFGSIMTTLVPEVAEREYNWWNESSQTGFVQDYSISLSGGTDKLSAFISLGLYDENGAVKGYDYTRYNTRVNVSYKAYDWLTVKPSLSASRRDVFDQQYSVSDMYRALPWNKPYDANGNIARKAGDASPAWVNVPATASVNMYDRQFNYTESRNYEFIGNFDFDVKIAEWLTFSSVNSYKLGENTYLRYIDPRSNSGESSQGSVENYFGGYDRIYANQLLRFNKTFGEKHSVNGILAYEWNEYNGKTTTAIGAGISPDGSVLNVTSIPSRTAGTRSQWAVQSYFANANYAYSNRYFAQASLRRDGASNFGRSNRYGTFFSLSAAWNIHEEEFLKNLSFVNSLKLRASYGSTGNRPGEMYGTYTRYSLNRDYSYNGVPGALISQVGNDNVGWETTYTANLGLDVSLFNGRLNLNLDIYDKNTSNLLYSVPLPGVTGVTGIWRNVGEVNNKGLEITLGGDVLRTKDLRWNIEANLGLNRNKVVELYGGKSEIIVGDGSNIAGSASKLLKPGMDVDTWYLPEWNGVDPQTGAPTWFTTNAAGERVVTTNYADAEKYKTTIGHYTPDFFGGFSTTITYKDFDLNAVFGYSVGGKIFNYMRVEFDSDGTYTDRNQMKLMKGWSRWQNPGDIATHPKPAQNNTSKANSASSRFLEDGSYLKMRSLTLGYKLPLKSKYIAACRLYATAENLFTLTGFSGVDPEIPPRDVSGDYRITGVFVDAYPATRKFMFGLNVTF